MTTIALIIGILVMVTAVALFGLSLARAAARADRAARRQHQEHLLRRQSVERRCVVCGEPVDPPYTLRGRYIHPSCRKDAA